MQPRITMKRGDEEVEQDLCWNVLKMTEAHYERSTEQETTHHG